MPIYFSKWELLLCDNCGHAGGHVECGHLIKKGKDYICPDCHEIDMKCEYLVSKSNNNNNLYLKSLHISTININCRAFIETILEHIYTIYIELWKCDLLKATTDDALDRDRTRDPSAQSLIRYRLHQPAPQIGL